MRNILFYFVLIFCNFKGQNINVAQKNIYLAQYHNKNKDVKLAINYYKKAFKEWPNLVNENFSDCLLLAVEQNNPSFFNYLFKIAFKESYYSKIEIIESNRISAIIDTNDKINLGKIYDRNKHYIKLIKIKKSENKIDEIILLDQDIRNQPNVDNQIMKKIDSLNFNKIVHIAKKDGWNDKFRIVLLHQRGKINDNKNENWNFFKRLINTEIKKGQIRKDFFVEFDLLNSLAYRVAHKYDFYPPLEIYYTFEDIKNIDIFRKAVGLPPLYFSKYLEPTTPLTSGYIYNPKNLLSDLKNL